MQQVVVEQFGGPEVMALREVPTPSSGPDEVLVRLTSIGMNHADLMGRRGEYKLSTGDPPFTPGLEGGGVIEAVGEGVSGERIGQRVCLAPDAPRLSKGRPGTYASHYVCNGDEAIPAPDVLPDDQLGAIWLPYLTAWGALAWKAKIQRGQVVACPAASSSTALAAAQIARHHGATTIGLTTSPEKSEALAEHFDHVVVTHEARGADGERTMRPWHREIKQLTDGRGVDVFFDPVAAGPYLSTEIRCLAQHGCVVVYGLLGATDAVDVTPLIRKHASIVGYVNDELFGIGPEAWRPGVDHLLQGFASGVYRQTLAKRFALANVQDAHKQMQSGDHVGKMVLIP
ncbi:MAG: zinc-dependent alcohol dehydrogenase family protein [Planctomycetota bacterium]